MELAFISLLNFIYTKILLIERVNSLTQWVSAVHATHILQCARAQDCIGYHLLSVNENLLLIYGVEKFGGSSNLDGVS